LWIKSRKNVDIVENSRKKDKIGVDNVNRYVDIFKGCRKHCE